MTDRDEAKKRRDMNRAMATLPWGELSDMEKETLAAVKNGTMAELHFKRHREAAIEALAECMDEAGLGWYGGYDEFNPAEKKDAVDLIDRLAALGWELRKKVMSE